MSKKNSKRVRRPMPPDAYRDGPSAKAAKGKDAKPGKGREGAVKKSGAKPGKAGVAKAANKKDKGTKVRKPVSGPKVKGAKPLPTKKAAERTMKPSKVFAKVTKVPAKPKATAKKAAVRAKAKAPAKAPRKVPAKATVTGKVPKKAAPGNKAVAPSKAIKAEPRKPEQRKNSAPLRLREAFGEARPKAPVMEQAVSVVPAPLMAPVPPKRPLKERIQMEFMVRSAPTVLFELVSTPSGFSEWYCDDVNVRGDQYTFLWPGEEESTTLIGRKLGEVVRFRRNDDDDEAAFFEFRVRVDAMTNEVALIVTDHAWPGEVEERRNLWNSQVAALLRVLGA